MLDPVGYADGATALMGRLARPAETPRAAVLVFPTIANATPAVEQRARMLADAGYLALIADYYGQDVPSFEASLPLAAQLRADVDGYRRRLLAGLAALRSVAPGLPVAAIGYCMGGQAVLELVREGADLALAASFHGLLATGRRAERSFAGRILLCHGDADPMVPRSDVIAFWEEMDAASNHWHFHSYSGVRHGFTDPGSDARGLDAVRYDASADRQSWASLMALMDEVFGPKRG